MVAKFYEEHYFLQCVGATDGAPVGIKSINDFINRKGIYTVNCQAAADYTYCFFDVVVKYSGSLHDLYKIVSEFSYKKSVNFILPIILGHYKWRTKSASLLVG